MPKRNLLVIFIVVVSCLAAYAAREQAAHGRRFAEVLAIVEDSYLDPVDGHLLFDTAVDAALARLDEHSAYMRGDTRSDLEATLDQRFGGVGLELVIDATLRMPVVTSPVLDSPAWRAGIRAGDRLERIDGEPVAGKPLRDIVALLRGPIGERVTIDLVTPPDDTGGTLDPAVKRDAHPSAREISLMREVIETESVLGDRRLSSGAWEWMLEATPGIAYARIVSFGERTTAEFSRALDAMSDNDDLRGLIIDLRGNPGGLLSAAVEICDLLLDDGVIVHTRARRRHGGEDIVSLDTRRATEGARLEGVPIAILVDSLTASAAEIIAGCLQDSGRAKIVGSRTFGKGTVQSVISLSDDRGLLKLTTSEYLRPSGATIHRRVGENEDGNWGVLPDPGYEVSPSAEGVSRIAAWRRSREAVGPVPVALMVAGLPSDVDPVLAKALDALVTSGRSASDFGSEKKTTGHDDGSAWSRK